jgi:hypothetical protein
MPSEFRRGLPAEDGEVVVPKKRPVRNKPKVKATITVPSRYSMGHRGLGMCGYLAGSYLMPIGSKVIRLAEPNVAASTINHVHS